MILLLLTNMRISKQIDRIAAITMGMKPLVNPNQYGDNIIPFPVVENTDSFLFSPSVDITAYELSVVISKLGICADNKFMDSQPPRVTRHFNKNDVVR